MRKFILFIIAFFTSQFCLAQSNNAPQSTLKGYMLSPGEAPEEYIVEDGDTLHDICDQLLDNPKYWPKLWSLNPEIQNPHFISPGTRLKFYPGDYMTPPSLNVVSEDDLIAVDTSPIEEPELYRPDISHLLYDSRNSQTIDFVDAKDLPYDPHLTDSFNTFGEVHDPNSMDIVLPAFIFKEKPKVLAEVVSGTLGQLSAKPEDIIVLELKAHDSLKPKSSYTVVRPSIQVDGLNENPKEKGYRYEFVANVNVIEHLNDKNYIKSQVFNSRLGVEPHDLIIPFTSTIKKYYRHEKVSLLSDPGARVIGFEYPNQQFSGNGQGVFLNKPIKVGSYLPVYQKINVRASRLIKHELPEIQDYIGLIQIVHNFDTSSFGVVINNTMDVRVGDTLGKK